MPSALARAVLDVMLEGQLDPKTETAGDVESTTEAAPADLKGYVGVFRNSEESVLLATSIQDGSLHLGFVDGKELTWLGNDTFNLPEYPASRFRFEIGEDGAATSLALNYGYGETVLTRCSDPGDVAIDELVGSYVSDELGVTWEIAIADGKAELRRRKSKSSPIYPVGRNAFAAGEPQYPMEFVFERDRGGVVTGFRLNQGRIRNLVFEREA